jgi:hypothetical protein
MSNGHITIWIDEMDEESPIIVSEDDDTGSSTLRVFDADADEKALDYARRISSDRGIPLRDER